MKNYSLRVAAILLSVVLFHLGGCSSSKEATDAVLPVRDGNGLCVNQSDAYREIDEAITEKDKDTVARYLSHKNFKVRYLTVSVLGEHFGSSATDTVPKIMSTVFLNLTPEEHLQMFHYVAFALRNIAGQEDISSLIMTPEVVSETSGTFATAFLVQWLQQVGSGEHDDKSLDPCTTAKALLMKGAEHESTEMRVASMVILKQLADESLITEGPFDHMFFKDMLNVIYIAVSTDDGDKDARLIEASKLATISVNDALHLSPL